MWSRLKEQGVTLRAFGALCVAGGLAVLLFADMQVQSRMREQAIISVASDSWKVSELIFETQRLSSTLTQYTHQAATKEDVELQFDVLWSRLTVVEASNLARRAQLAEAVNAMAAFLSSQEESIYSASEVADDTIQGAVSFLDNMTLEIRKVWHSLFSRSQAAQWADEIASETQNSRWGAVSLSAQSFPIWALCLILALIGYVVAEVYFANRAHKRVERLRVLASQSSEAKTRFLANVSHEIRTPLNGILGMASELGESSLDEDQSMCLNVIEQSGAVLLDTINDVLDLSRVEAGQMQVETRAFVLQDALEAACALYRARAREKNLRLELIVQENLPKVILGDERRIRQVMHNLIANAIKFTEKGGVTVRALPDEGGTRLSLSVRDTGPGIPRDAQARIFEPFGQADVSITRLHGGSGLGLTISRQLCETMGGGLTLVSRDGAGATFFCDLPLDAASDDEFASATAAPTTAPRLHGQRLLIADDNATNRLILSRFLKDTGAELSFAKSGEEAVNIVSKREADIVLMDIQMPGMDGVTATQTIRELEQTDRNAPVVIIAVTANVLVHQVREYRAAGVDDVLAKPVSKQALFAMLHRYMAVQAA